MNAISNATKQSRKRRPARLPAPGDGTYAIIDRLIWLLSLITFIPIFVWWLHWGDSRGLEDTIGLSFYAGLFVAAILAIAVHEGGHAIAGKILGMKLLLFFVGPFQWRNRHGKWKFHFHAAGMISLTGLTSTAPTKTDNYRVHKIIQVAAGPLTGLFFGLVAAGVALSAPGRYSWQLWNGLICFSTTSLVCSVFSLVPHRTKGGYSDGAKLYQLRSEGLWSDYYRAYAIVFSSLVTPLRPKEYDVETLNRTAGYIAHGQSELLMHLYAYSCYFDRGQFSDASDALAKAESVYENSAPNLPAECYGPFIFGNALLRRDPARTRLWWERMEAKLKSTSDEDGLLIAQCAYLWMENRLAEAQVVLQRADAWTQGLPHAGAYESEREGIALLRAAIEDAACSSVSSLTAELPQA